MLANCDVIDFSNLWPVCSNPEIEFWIHRIWKASFKYYSTKYKNEQPFFTCSFLQKRSVCETVVFLYEGKRIFKQQVCHQREHHKCGCHTRKCYCYVCDLESHTIIWCMCY